MVITKKYSEPKLNKKEILRYAGCKEGSELGDIEKLLEECLEEALPRLSYKLCYLELPIAITGDTCDFGCMQVQSKDLVKNLTGCEKVLLFGATIGVEIDRLIARYAHISQAKAMMFQAIGAERIEALCDAFCEDVKNETRVLIHTDQAELERQNEEVCILHPRFSPGYGDLSIEAQRTIFEVLNCSKVIGLSLNDSFVMSPSKSVTAFVGIDVMEKTDNEKKENVDVQNHKCSSCKKKDCAFREK